MTRHITSVGTWFNLLQATSQTSLQADSLHAASCFAVKTIAERTSTNNLSTVDLRQRILHIVYTCPVYT